MKHVLTHGHIRFSADIEGPDDGEAVFLIHGFPDHRTSFRDTVPALVAAGYRTIAPTLRGYEASSQHNDNDYHVNALSEDVFAWMDDLGIESAHVVGHDWGAVIGYAAAARRPERIRSFVSLAIPGIRDFLRGLVMYPRQLLNSYYMFLFQLPIARRVLARNDYAMIDRLWRSWSPGRSFDVKDVKAAFREPGVADAAIRYYRGLFDLFTPKGRRSFRTLLGPLGVPTLAVTGARDGCLDTRVFRSMHRWKNFPAGLRVEHVDTVGHFMQREQPEKINALILEFLRHHSQGNDDGAQP